MFCCPSINIIHCFIWAFKCVPTIESVVTILLVARRWTTNSTPYFGTCNVLYMYYHTLLAKVYGFFTAKK